MVFNMKILENKCKSIPTIVNITCPNCTSRLEVERYDFEIFLADASTHYDTWKFKCPCCRNNVYLDFNPFTHASRYEKREF